MPASSHIVVLNLWKFRLINYTRSAPPILQNVSSLFVLTDNTISRTGVTLSMSPIPNWILNKYKSVLAQFEK